MSLPLFRRAAVASVAVLATASAAFGLSIVAPTAANAATPSVTIAVPAYFNDDALWDKVLATPEVTYVIGHPLAPVAGQTYKADPDLVARLQKAKAKGKTTLVYVTAGYDKTDWKVVADRIDTILDAYPAADGVFIDEINYDQCEKYTSLTKGSGGVKGVRARHADKLIVLNPGAPMLNCYDGLADGYVNLERADKDIPAWTDNVNLPGNVPFYSWMFTSANRPKMWEMVHTVAPADAASAVDAALTRNASVVYITNDGMPNPYDQLPSDSVFNAVVDRVGQYASGKLALPAVKAPVLPSTTTAAKAAGASPTTKKATTKKVLRRTTTKKR